MEPKRHTVKQPDLLSLVRSGCGYEMNYKQDLLWSKLNIMTLQEKLVATGKMRWLDVGCGPELDYAFEGLDILPKNKVSGRGAKYRRGNILNLTAAAQKALGTFDLIRMQHVFEHFSFEDGHQVLINCAKLLKKGGYIVITVPDLKVYIQRYLRDEFKQRPDFIEWAKNAGIGVEAPNSAFFSLYTHSGGPIPHQWCYDYEGLEFQLKRAGLFTNIQELKPDDTLASVPFTHNRPAEEACAIAQKSA